MPFPHSLFPRSTWRAVGLTLTTVIFGLGTLSIASPTTAASSLGILPPTTEEARSINGKAMVFLGIRDVAAAAALAVFCARDQVREMGVLTCSWVLVCVVDTVVAAQGERGVDGGVWGLVGGAVVCAGVGMGLVMG